MKILIENATIISMQKEKLFIRKGYLYIDKSIVRAFGEGETPPELEFAEYVIDGRGRVVLPGFVVGIGNIYDFVFRYVMDKDVSELMKSLSKQELSILLDIALTSLAMYGATSVVTFLSENNPLEPIAHAASESWIRVRSVIKNPYRIDLDQEIKKAYKNVVEADAISKGIVTFGVYLDKDFDKNLYEIMIANNGVVYLDMLWTRTLAS